MARLEDKITSMVSEEFEGINAKGLALQNTMRRAKNALEALREQCPHEERNITRNWFEVVCGCGVILWSAEKTLQSIKTRKIGLSEDGLTDIAFVRKRFEREYNEAEVELGEFQKICPHPQKVLNRDPMTDNYECGICRIDLDEIP